jgi:hypothetical protein
MLLSEARIPVSACSFIMAPPWRTGLPAARVWPRHRRAIRSRVWAAPSRPSPEHQNLDGGLLWIGQLARINR